VPAHVYWYQMWIVDALVIIAGSSDLMWTVPLWARLELTCISLMYSF
jgi:hypothetical protein